MSGSITPLRVYGSDISYFTGKLEAYLRYKEIPYQREPGNPMPIARRYTGNAQIPAVLLADGRWLTDTTPILDWLETQVPEPRVVPADPLQAFASRLLEDYADEWLWRPAMHYRWSYPADAALLSRKIVDEMLTGAPLPAALKRLAIRTRQRVFFVRRDGVDASTRAHVEAVYLRTLDQLQGVLAVHPFLLGDVPTLADFGFFASMFRHFGTDPTPSKIMRERAPEVHAWVARMWDARASLTQGSLVDGIPAEWSPILEEIGASYLPHLCANAEAWIRHDRRFDVEIQGVLYRGLRTARYRVWCLERLRDHFDGLPEAVRGEARALLDKHGCWEPLWRVEEPVSGVDPERRAPFAPGCSMTGRD